jgi:hypothetical protein
MIDQKRYSNLYRKMTNASSRSHYFEYQTVLRLYLFSELIFIANVKLISFWCHCEQSEAIQNVYYGLLGLSPSQ